MLKVVISRLCMRSDNSVSRSTTKDNKKGVRQNGFTTKVASPKVAEMVFCSAGVHLLKPNASNIMDKTNKNQRDTITHFAYRREEKRKKLRGVIGEFKPRQTQ